MHKYLYIYICIYYIPIIYCYIPLYPVIFPNITLYHHLNCHSSMTSGTNSWQICPRARPTPAWRVSWERKCGLVNPGVVQFFTTSNWGLVKI